MGWADEAPISRELEREDLWRPRLVEWIDMCNGRVKLEALIDWEFLEREWAGVFLSQARRAPPKLAAGLLYLQQA